MKRILAALSVVLFANLASAEEPVDRYWACTGWDDKEYPDIRKRISDLKKYLSDKKNKPPRCYEDVEDGASGNRKLCVECSYCAFKVDCWQDVNDGSGLRKFIYSSGPRWLTVVKKEPNVMEDLA